MISLIAFIVALLILVLPLLLQYLSERQSWNNGKCPACGEPWECFDMTSQGDLGYKCKNGHFMWMSYNFEKPHSENKLYKKES